MKEPYKGAITYPPAVGGLYSSESMFSLTFFLNLHSSPISIIFIPIFYVLKKSIFREIKYPSQGYTELRFKPYLLMLILMF